MLVVSSAKIFEIEKAIFAAGMPVEALMEKAGMMLALRIQELYPREKCPRVCVLVGCGHNGGDGLVIARELLMAGYAVHVWCLDEKKMKPLTASHLCYFKSCGGKPAVGKIEFSSGDCDFVVDALFGIGLARALEGRALEIIEKLNAAHLPVVAVDVPSGLCSDTGASLPAAVVATHTLTLGAFKTGFAEERALPYLGQLTCLDLGFSAGHDLETLSSVLSNDDWVAKIPKKVSQTAHKYDVGTALICAGSAQYPGAAVLCALAARAVGCGYLKMSVPTLLRASLAALVPDAVTSSSSDVLPKTLLPKSRAVLYGPGLGDNVDVAQMWDFIQNCSVTLVLDADALNAIGERAVDLSRTPGPRVLTPHAKEFERMFPSLALGLQAGTLSRIDAAFAAARLSHSVVVLKGPRTVIAAPTGEARVQFESTAALARAGTGDVLAGIIVSLAAQGLSAFDAACAAVGLHSSAALALETREGRLAVNAHSLTRELVTLLRA